MYQRFDENTKKILKNAKREMQSLKHPFVGSEHLILSILSNKDLNITVKLNEYNVNYDVFKKELIKLIGIGNSLNSYFIWTPLLKRIIENAIIETKEDNIYEVGIDYLFLSLLEEGEGVAIRIFNNLGVNIDELYAELENKKENKRFINKKKLSIYDHAIDLVEKAKNGKIDPVVGRDDEINRLIEILLRRNKNNPLLIGDAGVGKTAIVEALALKISNQEVPNLLWNKKILSVSMANLVAGTKYRGEFEDRIEKMIKEIESNPDIIVFIDEMHSIVGAGGAEGAIDAANILKPALARGKFRLIGATTLEEYKTSIEKDKALNRRFQTILIKEPDLKETINILKKISPLYEKYHGVVVKNEIIEEIVYLCDKYIFNRKNPDKCIDILDEVCAKRSLIKDNKEKRIEELKKELNEIKKSKNKYIIDHNYIQASNLKEKEILLEDKINKLYLNIKVKNKKEVLKEDILDVIKTKANFPIFEFNKTLLKNLNDLEINLKKSIIGQDEAIKIICDETKKIKLGLKEFKKPISFMFTGSSGVGKTELAKIYSKLLNINLIRIDASEYRESHTISKIIGAPPGYVGYDNYSILDDIKNNPYSVILIDEIDKACSSFINLFLQILDEGFITNSNSEKIYFNHAIIIMTCNTNSFDNSIGFNKKILNNNLNNIFSVEFLNRVNYIINFNKLNRTDIEKILLNEIKVIKNKFYDQKIELKIQKSVVNEIIELSDYEKNGARKLKKIMEDKIDNIVIDNILSGNKKISIKELV